MELKIAKRQKIKVPIMMTGASGSGKTASSLILAFGIVERMHPDLTEEELWEKVALIDSEHERALLYADSTIGETHIGQFLHLDLVAPFSVERYRQAFKICKEAGVEVVVIDSLSHAWSGPGGILEVVSNAGGSMRDWNDVKPLEQEFLKLVTENDLYVIGTTRSKQGYDFQKNDVGKTEVIKVGLKPDQKDTLEYEFAISFRIDQNHVANATKDNSNMFGEPFKITPETGHKIFDWSDKGIDVKAQEKEEKDNLITAINTLSKESEDKEKVLADLLFKVNNASLDTLATKVLERMKELLEKTN